MFVLFDIHVYMVLELQTIITVVVWSSKMFIYTVMCFHRMELQLSSWPVWMVMRRLWGYYSSQEQRTYQTRWIIYKCMQCNIDLHVYEIQSISRWVGATPLAVVVESHALKNACTVCIDWSIVYYFQSSDCFNFRHSPKHSATWASHVPHLLWRAPLFHQRFLFYKRNRTFSLP